MKIRSLDDLNKILSDQLTWRKKELSELKYLVEASSIPKHKKNYLYRSAITMIYAHWEGFLKLAGRYYLEFIYFQRLKNSELANNFLTISLESYSNYFTLSQKYSSYSRIVDFFEKEINSRAAIPFKQVVDTESNLSSNVLREITWCLGLVYDNYEIKEKLIDEKMLSKRNHIAHGEFLDVDSKDVIELRDQILALMIDFKNQIENSALTKKYLK